MASPHLGRIGLWSMELRFGDKAQAAEAAAEFDELGFGALWIPGGIDDAVLGDVDALLAATQYITIATGILNLWKHQPADVAEWFKALPEAHRQRVMIGVGVSHGPIIGDAWQKPLAATRRFLDGLDQAGMPASHVCLAALGPKMLALSAERSSGAHPYLVTPEHTASARRLIGPDKLLMPEQGVILESDPDKAREMARQALGIYIKLPNYRNNWLRLGLTQEDIDSASDRLVDALFAWGGVESIEQRVNAHFNAGADHVCLQLIQQTLGADIAGLRAAARTIANRLIA